MNFEGCEEGTGELILTLHKQDGTELVEVAWVDLELMDIKKMYNRGGHRGGVALKDLFKKKPWNETDDTIIFVHGWRMSHEGRDNFAETFYKRLWHRGFKGRFAAFQWDTYHSNDWQWLPKAGGAIDACLARYNDSEEIGWHSAENLKFFINEVVPGQTKHLAAHSMGNIVASESVRLGASVDNYALMQAAVPSAAYDEHGRTKYDGESYNHPGLITMWDKETPDDDDDPATRALAYRGRFKNLGAATNLVSFFLPQDYATLMPWEVNNDLMKPPPGNSFSNYRYTRNNPQGQKLYRFNWANYGETANAIEVFDYYLTEPQLYEAMAHACSTWGKAQGAQDVALGAIGRNVALNSTQFQLPDQPDFQGFFDQHSGQFNARIQNLKAFYDELLRSFDIARNP